LAESDMCSTPFRDKVLQFRKCLLIIASEQALVAHMVLW
jgi:hypothetical protein